MKKMRKRRRSTRLKQQAVNETPGQPVTADDFATAARVATPSPAFAEEEFLLLKDEIKTEISDNEAEANKETQNTKDDCQPNIKDIQRQWSNNHDHAERTPTSTSTPTIAIKTGTGTATATATVATLTSKQDSQSECALIIDKFNSDMMSDLLPVSSQVKNEIIDEEIKPENCSPTPLEPCKLSGLNQSDFNFDADDLDMQESDSDEDGYTDIDFDDDYQLLENDEISDLYDPEWLQRCTTPRRVFPNQNYKGFLEGGSTLHSHTYYFYNILDGLVFFETLAECCNKRAVEILEISQKWKNSYLEAFTWQEMSIFIGISLQMGSLQLGTLAEYWDCQSYYGFNGFSKTMSLDRFEFLLEVLNFEYFQVENDSFNNSDKSDPFYNLKPLLCFFNNRMESIYNCGQSIILNDPLIYWKGRLNWATDMNQKFRYNAVMLHLLTEPSRLILKISADIEAADKAVACIPKTLVVQRLSNAIKLLENKFGKGHIVFASKYYGSYALCLELAKLGTYSSGFLDNKRFGNSKELVLKNLDHYQFETRYADYIMMGKCRRRGKSTYFYSSDCLAIFRNEMKMHHHLKLVKEINWQLKTPSEIQEYMLEYQLALERTEIKWDKRLMFYVIHLISLNAYVMYKSQFMQYNHVRNKVSISYNQFRQEIIASLLNPEAHKNVDENSEVINTATKDTRMYTKSDPILRAPTQLKLAKGIHYPMELPSPKGKIVKRRCKVCFKVGLLIFSQFCCGICPGMPGLCEEPCFKIWHKKIGENCSECRI